MSIYNILLLTVGFGTYLGLMKLSRSIQNGAFAPLEASQKSLIFEAFSNFRRYSVIPGVVLLAIYLLLSLFTSWGGLYLSIGFGVAYLLYLVSSVLYIRQKLIRLGIDPTTVFKVVSALSIQYMGMIVVVVAIFIYYILKKSAIS